MKMMEVSFEDILPSSQTGLVSGLNCRVCVHALFSCSCHSHPRRIYILNASPSSGILFSLNKRPVPTRLSSMRKSNTGEDICDTLVNTCVNDLRE